MLTQGRYTVVYPTGDYRTLEVKVPKKGNLVNRVILKIKESRDFIGVGFLTDKNKVNFWRRFSGANPPERLARIQQAVDRIAADPEKAGLAYAMKENRCYRCGKELTVPASIHKGMGPECAKKNWTRKDQQAAYDWRAGLPPRPQPAPKQGQLFGEMVVCGTCGAKLEQGSCPNCDWAKMKNEFADQERQQEEAAFMSDPDMKAITTVLTPKRTRTKERPDLSDFENAPCGICGVPRYRCSC